MLARRFSNCAKSLKTLKVRPFPTVSTFKTITHFKTPSHVTITKMKKMRSNYLVQADMPAFNQSCSL